MVVEDKTSLLISDGGGEYKDCVKTLVGQQTNFLLGTT